MFAPVSTTVPACFNITPDVATGGNPNLGPETAKQFNLGVVLQPAPRFEPMAPELRVVLGLSGIFTVLFALVAGPVGNAAATAAGTFF